MEKPIEILLREFGSQAELARCVGVSLQAVHKWHKSGKVPLRRAAQLESITDGKFTAKFLRPDVFAQGLLAKDEAA